MKEFTTKELRLVEKNIGYFNKLSSMEKLQTVILMMAEGEDYAERYEIWKEETENGSAVSKGDRLEALVYILENQDCRNNINVFITEGMMEILIPELFNGMSDKAREKYRDYIADIGKVESEDPIMFINLFMFPFRYELIESVFDGAGFDKEAVEWLLKAQRLYVEFMEAKSVRGVRGFGYHHGIEFLQYMKEFGDNLYLITNDKKYRPVDSADIIKKWVASEGPYSIEDLNISDSEAVRIAEENGIKKEVLMELLMNYCLKHPQDNHEKILVFIGESYKGAKLRRALKNLEKAKKKNFI